MDKESIMDAAEHLYTMLDIADAESGGFDSDLQGLAREICRGILERAGVDDDGVCPLCESKVKKNHLA